MKLLLKELEKLQQYMQKEPTFFESNQKLGQLAAATEGPYKLALLSEDEEQLATFLNGLLGIELLPLQSTADASFVVQITYGETTRLSGVFKLGDRKEYDFQLLRLLSRERASSFFEEHLEYFSLEIPSKWLQGAILYTCTGGKVEEHLPLFEQLDDAAWLFRSSSSKKPTYALPFEPIGVSLDAEAEFIQEQQLALRSIIHVPILDATKEEQLEAYKAFTAYVEGAVQNPIQRKKKLLNDLNELLEELLISFLARLGELEYIDHCQKLRAFETERVQELSELREKTLGEVQGCERDLQMWDLLPSQITNLRQLYDILKNSPLDPEKTKIVSFISSLFSRNAELKRVITEFEELKEEVKQQYELHLGRGRRFFAKKEKLKEIEGLFRGLEQKHLACTRWRNEVMQSQQLVRSRIETALVEIEKEVYKKRGQLARKAYEAKQRYENRTAVQLAAYEKSYTFLQDYWHLYELQQYLQGEFIPFLREWGKNEEELTPFIMKIIYVLVPISKHHIPVDVDNRHERIVAALQPKDISVPESIVLPYKIKEQVPVHICEELQPTIPKLWRKNLLYTRPYALVFLYMLAAISMYKIASFFLL